MKIFLDVEFTDFKSPELISIGMVAESGECFYRELPFSIEKCSNFVCDTVLPLLSGAPSSVDAVAADLCVWLAQFDRPEILFDFAVDGKLFLDLYQWGGESVVMHLVQFDNQGWELVSRGVDAYFESHPEEVRHHSLCDARALRFVLSGV